MRLGAIRLGADKLGATNRLGAFRRSISYFEPDALWVVALLAMIGVSVLVSLGEAWPLAILIDSVLTKDPKGNWLHTYVLGVLPADKKGQVISLVAIALVLQVVGYAAWMGRMMINYYLNYRGTTRVRHALFDKLQRLGLAYQTERPQGDAIYRLTTDAFGPWGVVDVIIGTSMAAVTLTVMTAIMLSRNAPLTLAAFSIAPLVIFSNWRFGMAIYRLALASKQTDALLTAQFQQSITRIPLAQSFRREPLEAAQFHASVDRSVAALLRLNWQEQLYPFVRDTILAIGGAVILGYGGLLVYRDQFVAPSPNGMTVGTLLVFMDYLRKLWEPMKWLTEFVAKVRIFQAAAERVFHVLDMPEAVTEAPGATPARLKRRTLTIENVAFSYGHSAGGLRGVSAMLRPGEMIAFIGRSGAGKTTLLKLLLRYYDPTGGALRLDGRDFRSLRLNDLRAHFAFVPQEALMLNASIAENIGYGRAGATRQEIEAAAEQAGAAEFIRAVPGGYDSIVSEGGANLSGGQRQRIAVARALLSNAPILILDEPTSALDPYHERMLIDLLTRLKRRRSIILVTHRMQSVAACDRVYVMAAGRVIEETTGALFDLEHANETGAPTFMPPAPEPPPEARPPAH